ncbi:MAG: hypothetical protein HQ513_11710 [Rhodospirillales bacterium]|nr:hypothetical protein [Rhodospirillales bacterium]
MVDNSIGATLSRAANTRAKLSFEIQFKNIERNLISRFNKKVDKIEGRSGSKNEVTRLQKEANNLSNSLPALQTYRTGLLGSASALESLQAQVVTLDSTLDSNTDGNVDAAEVTAYTTLRDEIVASLDGLYVFFHPDINDGDIILKLKEEGSALAGQTPVVGALTDAANVTVTDYNAVLNNKVDIALSATINTISAALDLEQNITANFATRDTKILELITEEKAGQNEELEALQVDLANFLRAISLSFEANSNFADVITAGLSEQRPDPGSVLNLFT